LEGIRFVGALTFFKKPSAPGLNQGADKALIFT